MVREQGPREALEIRQHPRRESGWAHESIPLIAVEELRGRDPGRAAPVNLQKKRLEIGWIEALGEHVNQMRDARLSLDALDDRIGFAAIAHRSRTIFSSESAGCQGSG